MRAVVRPELNDQALLQWPYRKVKRPAETVIFEVFRPYTFGGRPGRPSPSVSMDRGAALSAPHSRSTQHTD